MIKSNILILKNIKLSIFNKDKTFWIIFLSLSIISIITKTWVSTFGPNPDLESWQIVGDIVSKGQTIYDNTARYNYGPIWGYICGVVAFIVKTVFKTNVYTPWFHIFISIILSLVDIVIAIFIYKLYGKLSAIIFVMNPISIIISGSHSQFDNLAIMFALIGWYYFMKSAAEYRPKELLYSYLYFGLSLATKHILLFFIPCLIFIPNKTTPNIITKIKFIAIPYIIFILGFLIEILRGYNHKEQIINEIIQNVIKYQGYGSSIFVGLINLTIPKFIIEAISTLPLLNSHLWIYFILMYSLSLSYINKKISYKYFLPFYLLLFFILLPAEARQYLAIPMLSIAVFYNYWWTIPYILLGSIHLFTTSYALNVNKTIYLMKFSFENQIIPLFPWNISTPVNFGEVQVMAIMLVIAIFVNPIQLKSEKLNIKFILNIVVILIMLFYLFIYSHLYTQNYSSSQFRLIKKSTNSKEIYIKCNDNNFISPAFLQSEIFFPPKSVSPCPVKIHLF